MATNSNTKPKWAAPGVGDERGRQNKSIRRTGERLTKSLTERREVLREVLRDRKRMGERERWGGEGRKEIGR